MDGKGRATDNIWIERFWKTIKYNHIYLNPCDTGLELFEGVQTYIEYYHNKKHQTIGMKPNEAYSISLSQNKMLHNSKQNINLAQLNFGTTTGEYYS